MMEQTMFNVRILKVNLLTGNTTLIRQSHITNKEKIKLWREYLTPEHIGAATSNLGYESKECPKYHTSTGVIKGTHILVTWTSWEI